jgi:hypothetical protein
MTPHDFVTQLSVAVVDENNAIYRNLLLNTDVRQASDPYWRRVLGLFGELTADQREVLLELTRQVTIDAAANVLGVIDGNGALADDGGRFRLIYGDQDLAGDLQSLFLEHAEQAAP